MTLLLGSTRAHYDLPLTEFKLGNITMTRRVGLFIGWEELKNALRHFKFTFHHTNLSKRNKPNQINPPSRLANCNFPQLCSWLMEAEIIVRPKWVKGKRCMSTQVSAKQREQHADFDDKYSAALSFTRRRPPRLSFCKWRFWGVEKGHGPCRGHGAHEPWW